MNNCQFSAIAKLLIAIFAIIPLKLEAQVTSLKRINKLADGTIIPAAICPVVSRDGNFVVFSVSESGLDVADPKTTIYLLNRNSGEVITVVSDSIENGADGCAVDISDDGRFVVFWSDSSSYLSGDKNGESDTFRFDRIDRSISLVSVSSTGVQGNGGSFGGTISSDGRYVAFESFASNLVPNDTNNETDIFVRDMVTGSTTRVSVGTNGAQGNNSSSNAIISGDGTLVAFLSDSSNFFSGDKNKRRDLFIRNITNGTTSIVKSRSSNSNNDFGPSTIGLSKDGRYVTFQAESDNFSKSDRNGESDVYLYDQETKKSELISVGPNGVQGNRDSQASLTRSISDDGCYVGFSSEATNLIGLDLNGRQSDIFIRDRCQKQTLIASVTPSCFQGEFGPYGPSLSADGKLVLYDTNSNGLEVNDNNSEFDSFLAELIYPITVNPDTILAPPNVQICGRNAGFTLPLVLPESANILPSTLAARNKSPKSSVLYELEINNTVNSEIKRINSKKNIISSKNIKPGNYNVRYRVTISKGKTSTFSTAFSPDVSFTVQ